MKRSEWVRSFEEQILGQIPVSTHPVDGALLHRAAEMAADACGLIWDSEEPEVLWEGKATEHEWPQRILSDGRCEWQCLTDDGKRWTPSDSPALVELARRLLAERELSIAMEGQRTEIREAIADDRLKQATVPGPLPWEKVEIADLPDGDRAAVLGTAAWIEGERASRDLGGEVRREEVAGRRRIARILKAGRPSYWYARHVGKVFEVELVEAEGQFKGSVRVAGYLGGHYVQPEDMEYLEFLDLGS